MKKRSVQEDHSGNHNFKSVTGANPSRNKILQPRKYVHPTFLKIGSYSTSNLSLCNTDIQDPIRPVLASDLECVDWERRKGTVNLLEY